MRKAPEPDKQRMQAVHESLAVLMPIPGSDMVLLGRSSLTAVLNTLYARAYKEGRESSEQ